MHEIVPYSASHRDAVIVVVQDVHREYGWTWEAHGYHRDLYEVESFYLESGGMFWVLLANGGVAGCVGVTLHHRQRPAHDPQGSLPIERNPSLRYCELHRLYLLSSHRGQGWGRRMLNLAMAFGRERGCRRMIAWSDTVLKDAHALYLQNGFVQEGERVCSDPDQSREYGFWKEPL